MATYRNVDRKLLPIHDNAMFPFGFALCTSISKRCGAFWLKVANVMPPGSKYCTRVVLVSSECELTYLQTVYEAACCGGLDEKHGVDLAAPSETGLFQTPLADSLFSHHFPFREGQCFLFTKHGIGTLNGNVHHRDWRHCMSFMFKLWFQPHTGQQVVDLFNSAVKPEC